MAILLILMGICTAVVLCVLWVKFVYWLIPRKPKQENPYIQYDQLVRKNDKWYSDYLNHLSKNGGGVPVKKVRTPEEIEADRKIKSIL